MDSKTKPRFILVVDDDEDILVITARFLGRKGYEVVTAATGEKAIEAFKVRQPDLILLDAQMPGMDGFQTCTTIKNLPGGSETPVVMVTGLMDDLSVERAFHVGAEEYINKPIKWTILGQRIQRILDHRASFKALSERELHSRLATNSEIDAIITVDSSDRVAFWNTGAERIFGFTSAEMLNEPVTRVMPERYVKQHREGMARLLSTGKPKFIGRMLELTGQRKNGEEFPLEISLSHWRSGKRNYFSAVIRDITERKRILSGKEGIALFDSHIIDQILSLANRLHQDKARLLVFQHVKSVMETVFLAGLRREEDRQVQVSVTLLDRKEFESLGGSNFGLVYEKRRPFTPDSLVKLGPGFDPLTASLAVGPRADDPKTLEIWGTLFNSKRGDGGLDPFPSTHGTIHALAITTLRPGSLFIRLGDQTLAQFQSGRFTEPVANLFNACAIGQAFRNGIENHPEVELYGQGYWSNYRALIKFILVETANISSGGTIIWLPPGMEEALASSVIPRNLLTSSPEGADLIAELSRHEKKQSQMAKSKTSGSRPSLARGATRGVLDAKRKLIEHGEMLARMTRVDGALILNHRLRPLCFGSTLIPNRWRGEVLSCQTTVKGPQFPVDLSRYGTRHSSAVDFVGNNPGTVGFVISHDGPVSALVRHEEAVLWVHDCVSPF
ncbi:MAG: response regulator [Magnetococcales bacterium]|nr:response regulator [Magnetococcales bacterium]MBF0156924.1 response regulator [Magnetococcales bacterium]